MSTCRRLCIPPEPPCYGCGFPPLTLLGPDAAHIFDLLFHVADAAVNFSAVGFQLSFTGSARADAAAKLRHLDASPRQARQHVLQLRQLYLQLTFAGAGVPRKNVEDELSAVDHAALDDFFYVALLGSGEVVIEEEKVGIYRCGRAGDLFQFARADQCRGIGPVAALQNFADNIRASASGQGAQFGQRFICVEFWNARLIAGWTWPRRAPARQLFHQTADEAASRAACACAVTFAPPRPRVRTSSPTKKARSRQIS